MPTNIYLQNLASIQKRTSPVKFAHLAEKSGNGSISNLSTKAKAAAEDAGRKIDEKYNVKANAARAAAEVLGKKRSQLVWCALGSATGGKHVSAISHSSIYPIENHESGDRD